MKTYHHILLLEVNSDDTQVW